MLGRKKSRIKPIYGQLIKFRDNIQDRAKVLKFKKKKWEKFLNHVRSKLPFGKWYKMNRIKSQFLKNFARKPAYWSAYKNSKYKLVILAYKKFRFFYGELIKKKVRETFKKIRKIKYKNQPLVVLTYFESRLSSILCRAKFLKGARAAKRLLVIGDFACVNGKPMSNPFYQVKHMDVVSINPKYHLMIRRNLQKAYRWPLPPEYLFVNYRTFQIYYSYPKYNKSVYTAFNFNLNISPLLNNFSKV